MSETIKTLFDIGDFVYHATALTGEKGVVVDILYSYKKHELTYTVSFGRLEGDAISMVAEELDRIKPII